MSATLEPFAASTRFEVSSTRTSVGLAALLDSPEMRARVCPLSVEACELLVENGLVDEKTELIRGLVIKKPTKSPLHCALAQDIFAAFHVLEGSGLVAFLYGALCAADSILEPDAMLVRGGERDFNAKHPTTAELVVEVEDASAEEDRAKAAIYAEAGVPEYWIVLGTAKQVEVYRQPENGAYQQKQLYTASETITCASVPDLQVNLAEWFE